MTYKSLDNKLFLSQITKTSNDGVHIELMNNIYGFVPREHLGLQDGGDIPSMYNGRPFLAAKLVEIRGSTKIFTLNPRDFK